MSDPCIRCGLCETVCPVELQPQFLHVASKSKDWARLDRLKIDACLTCQACTVACPSRIPLQDQFIEAQAQVKALKAKNLKALKSRARFEAREARKSRIEQLQAEHRANKLKILAQDEKQAAIEAALARVQWKFEDV